MYIDREIFAVFTMWLALMAVLGVWVVRITMLLHRQRRAEVAYRLHLAATMGTAMRERGTGSGSTGSSPEIVQPR
jgi:hypothetical protein